ncbi:MAG: four helix bundle protein [Nitrospirae bacterium]|nr:four helix bundle protein [Nitrospirota bacterium]
MQKIGIPEDLEVYKKLCSLHLEISNLTFEFPEFELHELGSQLRKSSNSAPSSIIENWNNKNINSSLEGIKQALKELRGTRHHLRMSLQKSYIDKLTYTGLIHNCNECERMLLSLQKSLTWKYPTSLTKNQFPDKY